MPKEYIYDENYQQTALLDSPDSNTPAEEHVLTTAHMKVTWGRDTYVQTAIVADDDPDGMEAQHLSLDRAGINRLIRTLRKARDQAYGTDA
jgi:hypothetical protein